MAIPPPKDSNPYKPRYRYHCRKVNRYLIIGWHLARPWLAPRHWSTETKAWISSHFFDSTCLIAFDDMQRWAKGTCRVCVAGSSR